MILANDDWSISNIGKSSFNNYVYDGKNKGKYEGYTYDNKLSCTQKHPCEVRDNNGIFSNENFGGTNSDIKTYLEKWYSENLKEKDQYISYSSFCNDTSYGYGTEGGTDNYTLFYGAEIRRRENVPSLKCPDPTKKDESLRDYGGIYKTKIGLLTMDEINMAGLTWNENFHNNPEYNEPYASELNYLFSKIILQSITPYVSTHYASVYKIYLGYFFAYGDTRSPAIYVVPVINLKSDVVVKGEGTSSNPYIVID